MSIPGNLYILSCLICMKKAEPGFRGLSSLYKAIYWNVSWVFLTCSWIDVPQAGPVDTVLSPVEKHSNVG